MGISQLESQTSVLPTTTRGVVSIERFSREAVITLSVARILVAPADLVKAFGNPSEPDVFDTATGEYNFEDNNLDCYALFDHKETDFYHGMNKEDEYYTTPENMKKAPHKRKRKYPNV